MSRLSLILVCLFSTGALAGEAIVGSWKTPFQELGDNAFYQLQRDFDDQGGLRQVLQVEIHHPLLPVPYSTVIDERSTYVVGGSIGTEGATAIEETLTQVFETIMTEAWVVEHNRDAYCGYTDWVLGVAKEITGRACNGVTHVPGRKRYDMFKIDGDSINFSIKPWHDAAIGSTPDLRPPVLGDAIGYVRQ